MGTSKSSRALRVAIVGAGIGGLAAAAALLRMGNFEVRVYERASELGEVGAGALPTRLHA